MRIGSGWDLHRLVPGRALVIGGVDIPSPLGEEAHSDGDVLLHALIDAILGAHAKGDIGSHFPPDDMKWKDADSKALLKTVLEDCPTSFVNIDCTIVLQRPKLREHVDSIRASLAQLLGIDVQLVSVKAKTAEHCLAELGSGEAISASVTILTSRP